MVRRVNLFGGPGVGKSTLAARVFAKLKAKGTNVELVQEFVKQYVYAGRTLKPWDYVHTFAEQLETERRMLEGGVDTIITDSPMLLQCFYAQKCGCKVASELAYICLEFEREFPSINFFLVRAGVYKTHGRWQTEEEALAMDLYIQQKLSSTATDFYFIDPYSQTDVDGLFTLVESS